jgi:predicted metalloprotease
MVRRVVCLVVVVFLSAACSQEAPKAAPTPSRSPSPTPPPKSVVQLATEDIQAYWATEFPEIYHDQVYLPVPPDRIIAAGAPGVDVPPCQGHAVTPAAWGDNAFYCFNDNYVVYDARSNGLIPDLQRQYGELAVAFVFAHEWGHAIQDRTGNVNRPTIYQELQADCFAGSWMARAADGQATGLTFHPGDLDGILSAMLTFRDIPGSRAGAADAHGSGFDRVAAFQQGFDEGASACVSYFADPPVITEIPFTTAREYENGGNMAAGRVLPVSVELLNDFYSRVARRFYRPIPIQKVYAYDTTAATHSLPSCGDVQVQPDQITNTVFFCKPDAYVILDLNYLQGVYEQIGDFGVSTLLAVPWASYVEGLQGFPGAAEGTASASLGADCYTGGFAAAMVNGVLSSQTLGGQVSLSPGDLDEAISAFIDADKVKGSHGTDATFARVDAFRDGFFRGYMGCDSYKVTASATPSP